MSRKLPNWIDAWLDYTSPLPSPELWRRWAGIFILAAAMERRMWVKTKIGNLYPNLYVALVGPPGVGKTLMAAQIRNFLAQLSDDADANSFHLASASETSASIVDSLREANRRIIFPQMEMVTYNSLTVVSNELGVILPEYDTAMMSKLTDIYDGHLYSERRRTKELQFTIPSPQINFITATTPSFLMETLPPGAWDQGFLSRTMLVFSSETLTRDLFGDTVMQDAIASDLVADLRFMFGQYGKMTFEQEAVTALEHWNRNGRAPLPDHPKLLHYNTRRAAHLLKLCMVASIARGDTRQVTIEDYRTAMDWLIELEIYMPEIFKAMSAGGDSRAMEDVWYHTGVLYSKEGKPISEARIVAYLAERIPAQNVGRVLDVMVQTGIFIEDNPEFLPGKYYRPRSRKI